MTDFWNTHWKEILSFTLVLFGLLYGIEKQLRRIADHFDPEGKVKRRR